jgi:acylphosphatase
VKNLADGRVEAVIQGPKDKVEALVRWCHKGPAAAIVEKVEVTWESTLEDFKDFRTRF